GASTFAAFVPHGAEGRPRLRVELLTGGTGRSGRRSKGDEMTTARDFMHPGAECIGENETLADAARKMRDMHVGSLPICGSDNRLHGIITDRDIVVKCVAEGGNPEEMT